MCEALFRWLLRFYPRLFREQYGEDVLDLFRDRYRESKARAGLAGVAVFWVRSVPHTMFHGLVERSLDLWRVLRLGSTTLWGNAVRGARRDLMLSATVVLTLAVGIGANVALFSVLQGVLIRPLPFSEPDRLVRLWETNPAVDDARQGPSPWNFVDWRARAGGFESMAAWYLTSGTYRTDAWVEEIRSAQVTTDFFGVLGVEPALGRHFRPEEVSGYGPVLLSHRVWERLFGADSSVVGQSIVSSGDRYEIVGVMPRGFSFPDESVDTWVAWDLPSVYADLPEARTWRFLSGIGRLGDGVSLAAAERSLDDVARELARVHPEANSGWDTQLTSLRDETTGNVEVLLWTAFAAVLCLLLIACANVANLLLAGVPARSRELAIRTTLGASRRRVVGELLAHYGVLAGVAGVIGLGLGALLLELLVVFDAGRLPRLNDVTIDSGVVVFSVLLSALTALLSGGVPALQALGGAVAGTLRGATRSTATRRQRRVREAFIGVQVAVAIMLLAGAGVFFASFERIRSVDTGLDPDRVGTFRVSLDPVEGTAEEIVRYYAGLEQSLATIPGVERVGGAQTLPLNPVGNDFRRPFRPEGSAVEAADAPAVQMRIVTPGYREAIGMTLLAGSDLPTTSRLDEPLVALVNRTLAERLWPGVDPVAQDFEIDFRGGWQPYRVVGVVDDVKHYGVREAARPEVFLSHLQSPYLAMTMVVRTAADPDALASTLRAAVLNHQPVQPAHDFVSMRTLLSASVAQERFLLVFFTVFAAIALLLAVSGIYAVISYVVSHQKREIGVRMALGARARDVVWGVTTRAVTVAAIGVACGVLGVVIVSGLTESLLFGVSPTDPTALALAGAAILLLGAAAAHVPARRAACVAPAAALGSE